ncbi:hypothetical protein [Shinella zoogloeoides]|uniref:hypothetical protein n=1 Tax=Shinella zoogloeoides TaxID=352475 RepID=UPI001F565923|nr:hypothetical protein [Shinella zoogloeoides]
MTLPDPPSDLSRGEKKAFRNLVKTLADRGIDPIARAGLVEEYVRTDARLTDLRAAEKQVEKGSKLAASRAVNVATMERRRLHEAIFKGAKKPEKTVAATVHDAAVDKDGEKDARTEAWRKYLYASVRTSSREAIEAAHGPCPLVAILYRSHEEEVGTKAILKAHGRRVVPREAWNELREACGGTLSWEARAPKFYNPDQDNL